MLMTGVLLACSAAYGESAADDAKAGPTSARTPSAHSTALRAATDGDVLATQTELLDLAYDAASAIKLHPHVRTRSRMQQQVVEAALELGRLDLAERYANGIVNWRKGAALADLALHLAERGREEEAERHLETAAAIARDAEGWRRDRTRMKIARAFVRLGETERAAVLEAGLSNAETGKIDAVRANTLTEEEFDQQMRSLHAMLATQDFDLTRNALNACVRLFDRFYGNESLRQKAEEKIKSSWGPTPIMVRLEVMFDLARAAAGHQDQTKARSLLDEARAIMESYDWTAEHHVKLLAELAELRAMAGDLEAARRTADNAIALYEREIATILTVFRVDALLPLAEARHAMGDRSAAIEIYRKALEEGSSNPNLRPRAEDLCILFCSMALHGVEPDDALRTRIHEVCNGLGPQ